MTWETYQVTAVINLMVCMSICWACMCRLNADICRQHLAARARYALLMGGAMASGLQPLLWGTWPSAGDVLFGCSVLAGLIINVVRWRGANGEGAA